MAGKKKEFCTLTPGKQWGGSRERQRRKRKWQSPGETKTIRVPECLADAILNYAQKLDAGEDIESKHNKLKKRLVHAEYKLQQLDLYLNYLEQLRTLSTANGQKAPAFPTKNRSVSDQKPPRS